jgi:3-hydroxyacyl-[acyl-carrier-protein] dehydratase
MSTTLPPADIGEILRHIPHRYPFLLIDRMQSCEPHRRVHVIKNVAAGEWFFGGNQCGVMPQLLIVEALAQSAGVLCHFSGLMGEGKSLIFFAGVENLVCKRDVRAGDTLDLVCTLKRALRGVVKLDGEATVDGEVVLAGELTAVIRPHPSPPAH